MEARPVLTIGPSLPYQVSVTWSRAIGASEAFLTLIVVCTMLLPCSGLVAGCVGLAALGLACANAPAAQDAAAPAPLVLSEVRVGSEASTTVIDLFGLISPDYVDFRQDQPARIVVDLTHARAPQGVVRTADLKPRGGRPVEEARADYRGMVEGFTLAVSHEVGDRRSRSRHPHPWFGPLTAYQWLCFAPFHQTIHLAQARRICRALRRCGV